ncbi:MAG: hypothetical protein PVG30_01970 [Gammaproteobacteria bacterium]|jgi:hypothetical protein
MGIIKKYDLQCDFCENKLSDDYKEVQEFDMIGQIMHFAKDNLWDYKKLKGIQKQKWRCPECRTKKAGEEKEEKEEEEINYYYKFTNLFEGSEFEKKE